MEIMINGHALQGDFFDADFIDRYESATREMQKAAESIRGKVYTSTAEGYRENIAIVNKYIDGVFGPGAAATVFEGASGNLLVHLKAVDELTSWAKAQKKELNDFSNRYTQRRQAQARQEKAVQNMEFRNFVANQGSGKKRHK